MKVSIITHTPDPEFIICLAGRTCYNSRNKDIPSKRGEFIKKFAIEAGHDSLLEHATISFDVEGISRFTQNQIVRHRIGCSYCVQSLRYCDARKLDIIIEPNLAKKDDSVFDLIHTIKSFYCKLVDNGVPKEEARALLPLGTATNMVITMNFRALRHFLKLRLDTHAQREIRELAQEMKALIIEKGWAWLVEDI